MGLILGHCSKDLYIEKVFEKVKDLSLTNSSAKLRHYTYDGLEYVGVKVKLNKRQKVNEKKYLMALSSYNEEAFGVLLEREPKVYYVND